MSRGYGHRPARAGHLNPGMRVLRPPTRGHERAFVDRDYGESFRSTQSCRPVIPQSLAAHEAGEVASRDLDVHGRRHRHHAQLREATAQRHLLEVFDDQLVFQDAVLIHLLAAVSLTPVAPAGLAHRHNPAVDEDAVSSRAPPPGWARGETRGKR